MNILFKEPQNTFINLRFFEKNPEYKLKNALLYSVKIRDKITNERFYKKGINSRTIEERFGEDLELDVIEILKSNFYDCYIKEEEIHKKNRSKSLVPQRKISGYTECYREPITIN